MAAKTDPKKLAAFLDLLALGHTVQHAAAEAGVGRSTVYGLREADKAFAAGWAEAEEAGTQVFEQEGRRRALEGTSRPVYQGGALVGHVQHYSDTLLIFLLKSRRPGVYRDHFRHEHVGADGKDITVRLAFDPSEE